MPTKTKADCFYSNEMCIHNFFFQFYLHDSLLKISKLGLHPSDRTLISLWRVYEKCPRIKRLEICTTIHQDYYASRSQNKIRKNCCTFLKRRGGGGNNFKNPSQTFYRMKHCSVKSAKNLETLIIDSFSFRNIFNKSPRHFRFLSMSSCFLINEMNSNCMTLSLS